MLANERSHGRISERAYRIGRIVENTFERAGGLGVVGRGCLGERIDTSPDYQTRLLRGIDQAKRVTQLMAFIERVAGTIGARFLRKILCDGFTFGQCAADRGMSGSRGAATAASTFRLLLEELAERWDWETASSR